MIRIQQVKLVLKLLRTAILNFFKGSGIKVATARAGNVIGGGDMSIDRLIPDYFRSLQMNKPLTIRNPLATRPWQHVLEPVSAIISSLKIYHWIMMKNFVELGILDL